jgi:hypothetical protein
MSDTQYETAVKDIAKTRRQTIASLRRLAYQLEATAYDAFPTPRVDAVIYFTHTPEPDKPFAVRYPTLADIRELRKAIAGGWRKHLYGDTAQFTRTYPGDVRLIITAERAEQCTRVQVGTRHVEAVAAHDEPIYEWRCGPSKGGK